MMEILCTRLCNSCEAKNSQQIAPEIFLTNIQNKTNIIDFIFHARKKNSIFINISDQEIVRMKNVTETWTIFFQQI